MTRLETLTTALAACGLPATPDAAGHRLSAVLATAVADFRLLVWLDPEDGDVLFLVPGWLRVDPTVCAPEVRARLAELLLTLNWDLALGGFELDPTDGEVRFRLACPWVDGHLGPASVRRCVAATRWACEHAWRACQSVLWGGAEVSAARAVWAQGA
jgi:hypothetical protein